jgi:DNA helicase II / ATP-dependent DNA helicase PcrA
MSVSLSKYQQAIVDAVKNSNDCLSINACAGSGKTFTLLECMKHINTYSAVFIAFNKSIADELAAKVPGNFQARTFHSICFEAWREFCDNRRLKVDEDKVWSIIWKLLPEEDVRIYGYFIKQLVGLAKNMGIGTDILDDSLEEWNNIIDHHNLEIQSSKGDITIGILHARKVLNESSKSKYVIDFDDMLYLPLLYGATFRRYDVIFVDEAQDLSGIQHALLESMISLNGRLIAVGDPHQAIYGFRGSDSESMDKLSKNFDCVEFPLSVTYRCDEAIVEHAKKWVPHIEARKYAGPGTVEYLDKYSINTFDESDVIICRNSAPLVSMAYGFIRRGRKVNMLGRDIGDGLIILIDKMKTEDIDELEERLLEWYKRELEKALKKRNEQLMISIEDKYQCIKIFIENLPEPYRTVDDLCYEIARMFKETEEVFLTLCTGHKSKGLEWNHVFWLEKGLIPSKYATRDWMLKQENNLSYVITTRARHHLSFIELSGWDLEEKYKE